MNILSTLICLDGSYIGCWCLYFYTKRTSNEYILQKSKNLYYQSTFDRYIFYFFITLFLKSILFLINCKFNFQFQNEVVGLCLGIVSFPKAFNHISIKYQQVFQSIKLARIQIIDELFKKLFGYFLSDLLYNNHSYFRFTKSYSESLMVLKNVDKTKIGLFLCNCVCIFLLYRFRNADEKKYYIYYKVIKYIYWTFSNYKYEHTNDPQFLKEYIVRVIENNWEQIDSPIFAHAIVDIMESKNWIQQHSKKLEFHVTIYFCMWSICYWFDNSFLSLIFVIIRDKKTKQFKFKEAVFKLTLVMFSYIFGIHYLITNFLLLTTKSSVLKDIFLFVLQNTKNKRRILLNERKMKFN